MRRAARSAAAAFSSSRLTPWSSCGCSRSILGTSASMSVTQLPAAAVATGRADALGNAAGVATFCVAAAEAAKVAFVGAAGGGVGLHPYARSKSRTEPCESASLSRRILRIRSNSHGEDHDYPSRVDPRVGAASSLALLWRGSSLMHPPSRRLARLNHRPAGPRRSGQRTISRRRSSSTRSACRPVPPWHRRPRWGSRRHRARTALSTPSRAKADENIQVVVQGVDHAVGTEQDRLSPTNLQKAFTNVTSGAQRLRPPDKISATHQYLGTTTRSPNCSSAMATTSSASASLRAGVLAVTCFWISSGKIIEADMKINNHESWALSLATCHGDMPLLESTVTHEAGHVFGLDHVGETQARPADDEPVHRRRRARTTRRRSGSATCRGLESLY